ncbi:MAG: hypothetical protein K2O01_06340, partial [Bacteroidales bacterium]|nr:hypothetical protein [Bacteroidales bacterium]
MRSTVARSFAAVALTMSGGGLSASARSASLSGACLPADTVAAYCDTLLIELDSADQVRVDRAIDAAVDSAVVK